MAQKKSSGHQTKGISLNDTRWHFIESHFGGLSPEIPKLNSAETSSFPKSEEDLYDMGTSHERFAKQDKERQSYIDELAKLRERIQEELDRSPEVIEVSNLFEARQPEVEELSPFLPVVATLQLPERFNCRKRRLFGVNRWIDSSSFMMEESFCSPRYRPESARSEVSKIFGKNYSTFFLRPESTK